MKENEEKNSFEHFPQGKSKRDVRIKINYGMRPKEFVLMVLVDSERSIDGNLVELC